MSREYKIKGALDNLEISYVTDKGELAIGTVPEEETQCVMMVLPDTVNSDSSISEITKATIELSEEILQGKETILETRNRHKAQLLQSEKVLTCQRAVSLIHLGIKHNNRTLLNGGLLKRFEMDHCTFRPIPDTFMNMSIFDMEQWLQWHLNSDMRTIIKAGCFNAGMRKRTLGPGMLCVGELPLYLLVVNGYITGINWEHPLFIDFLRGLRGYDEKCVDFTYPDWRIDAMGYKE
jgi:hypothetical protein